MSWVITTYQFWKNGYHTGILHCV